ncbi:hypothetical protein ACH5RR_003461 [Cinchona calisaya]|uniref:Uncharacterized protein n=1 Tax=Cinchona calisaya TaxID=153742 RepID=A0ABD3AUU1_9GENT
MMDKAQDEWWESQSSAAIRVVCAIEKNRNRTGYGIIGIDVDGRLLKIWAEVLSERIGRGDSMCNRCSEGIETLEHTFFFVLMLRKLGGFPQSYGHGIAKFKTNFWSQWNELRGASTRVEGEWHISLTDGADLEVGQSLCSCWVHLRLKYAGQILLLTITVPPLSPWSCISDYHHLYPLFHSFFFCLALERLLPQDKLRQFPHLSNHIELSVDYSYHDKDTVMHMPSVCFRKMLMNLYSPAKVVISVDGPSYMHKFRRNYTVIRQAISGRCSRALECNN